MLKNFFQYRVTAAVIWVGISSEQPASTGYFRKVGKTKPHMVSLSLYLGYAVMGVGKQTGSQEGISQKLLVVASDIWSCS